MPAPGTPRYQIERQIGRGSRADVFLAFDRILNRKVALKQFRERPIHPDSLQREFRILSGLGHPRVVRVFDLCFPAAGLPFLTMEYLRGPSLQHRLPRPAGDGGPRGAPPFAPAPLAETIEVALGIAAGLRHLHSRKLIHGDLKPTNILYRSPGSARRPDPGDLCLVDFGLARGFRRARRMEFSGTFRYAAPEMVQGRRIDARSDLFSLGLLLFELLTGRHPYDLMFRRAGRFEDAFAGSLLPSAERPDLPADLDRISRRVLHHDPRARYRSAEDLMAELLAVLPARTSGAAAAPRDWFRFELGTGGREPLMRRLTERMRRTAQRGRGSRLVIVAPAGFGKGRLLHALLDQRKADLAPTVSVSARSDGSGVSEFTAAILERIRALGHPLRGFPEAAEAGVAGASARASLLSPAPDRLERGRHDFRRGFAESIARTAAELPGRGLVVAIEGLESAHEEVGQLVAHLRSALRSRPVTLLATWDTDEAGPERTAAFLRRLPPAERVSLRPIAPADLRRFLDASGIRFPGREAFLRAAIRRTRGNLVMLEEYLNLIQRRGVIRRGLSGWIRDGRGHAGIPIPASLEAVYLRKLAQSAPACRRLLQSLCVLGQEWEEGLLRAVFLPEIPGLRRDLQGLVDAGLIRKADRAGPPGSVYSLIFPGLRRRLIAGFPREAAARLHLRCARHLATRDGGSPLMALRIGRHHYRAGCREGIPYLLAAGDRFRNHFDLSAASRAYRMALTLAADPPDRNPILWRLGEIALLRGQHSEAIRNLLPLHDLPAADLSAFGSRAELEFRLARGFKDAGRLQRSAWHLIRALGACPSIGPGPYSDRLPGSDPGPAGGELGICIRAMLGWVRFRMGRVREAERILREVESTIRPRTLPDLLAEVKRTLGALHLWLGRRRPAERAFREGLALYRKVGNRTGVVSCLNGLGGVLTESDPLRAARILRRAETLALRVGALLPLGGILTNLCRTYASLGRYEEALDAGTRAVRIHRDLRLPEAARPLLILGNIHRNRGEDARARELYREASDACRGGGLASTRILIGVNLSALERSAEHPAPARRALSECRRWLPRAGPQARASYLLQAADLDLEGGRLPRAARRLDRARRLLRATGGRSHRAREALLRGRLLARAGRRGEARRWFRASRRFAREIGNPRHALAAAAELERIGPARARAGVPRRPGRPSGRRPGFPDARASRPAGSRGESQSTGRERLAIGGEAMKTSDSSIFFHLEKMAGLFRSFRDLDRLLEQILGYLITVAEAERGFLFLCDERAGDLRLAASVRPDPETVTDALGISQSILRGSLSRTAPTYSSNALQDERFRRADSVVKYRIRSFVCTPMWFEDKILGTIYLDNRSPRGGFREEDANLLFAFASFLAPVIVNARRTGRLESNLLRLQEQMSGVSCPEALLGRSRKLREVLRLVDRVKETEASVLILGESGTGKELLARSLHLQGPRRLGPFVPVNCAAIPDTLIESELFGVARGAATDVRERAGKFEEADGGTVFLDEIGDLSRNAQAKVLRALQEREIQRVGSNARIPVDIRIVSATNRDLEALLARGAFREDLYFRINVIPIHLPPLRERREDIPLLMAHFNESSCRAVHRSPLKIPEATVRSYQAYRWPGNIRELRNVIERAVILVEEDTLPLLGEDRAAGELYRASLERALGRGASEDALRVDYTRRVLRKVGGNKRRACAILGIDFKTLQKRLQGAARRPRKPPLPPPTRV